MFEFSWYGKKNISDILVIENEFETYVHHLFYIYVLLNFMELHGIDWAIIILLLSVSIGISLYYKKRASQGMESFLLGGRKFPWYLAGISMVATTFAADTPLAVTEIIAKDGVSGNWIWWAALIGGMFTTFFFAALWRKSGVLTEVEFIELRYSGKPAKLLRGLKSVYLGLIMNVAVIAWVNTAMLTILQVFFDLETSQLWMIIFGLMLFAALYSSLGGLWGVAVTDAVQFIFAMVASILLAYFVVDSPEIGSLANLKTLVPEGTLNFFPSIGETTAESGLYAISLGTFIAFVGVQWWSSWYPGAEPGGGGYVAQRMMSTKTDKDAVFSGLFFQIAHYSIRPWPWIIVALAGFVLYPDLMVEAPRMAYASAMKDFLPVGFKGLLLASFLAAYLSTISTQLNWGAGYLTNDLYKRFIRPEASDKNQVQTTRLITLILAILGSIISLFIKDISGVWEFVMECGAGLGFILIVRWYWWRINALTEITATIAPFVYYSISKFIIEPQASEAYVNQKGTFFFTVILTVITALIATFISKPESNATLKTFFDRVKPNGFWKPFSGEKNQLKRMPYNFIAWFSGIVLTYSILFGTGYFLFDEWDNFKICLGLIVITLSTLVYSTKRIKL